MEPTMRYRPDAVQGARLHPRGFYYQVFEGEAVDECLKGGWYVDFNNMKPKRGRPANKDDSGD